MVDVERHYGRGGILDAILQALRGMGKDVARLVPADLAPVDQFHIRGREATVQLVRRASLAPGSRVLDVGCGLGGSARYLAAEHRCRVTGIDLTGEYVDAARALAELVGLREMVEFRQASALAMPFDARAFDVVWTEHVQMNIADKRTFYREIARVLVPRGRLLFHDVFQGEGGPVHYPVPWAEEASISFLATPDAVREILEGLGFSILDWEDTTQRSLDWFASVLDRLNVSGPPPLGTHLLMGETARAKVENIVRNLRERRIVVVQAVAERKEPSVSTPRSATTARSEVRQVAPKLIELSETVLYGDVWERPGLSKRDRSLITVAALVAMYRGDQLPIHLERALGNGVTREEIGELITHLAFYAGWPAAMSAGRVARKVFDEAKP